MALPVTRLFVGLNDHNSSSATLFVAEDWAPLQRGDLTLAIYRFHSPRYGNDYEATIKNGLGLLRGSAGYQELIDRGYPEPADPSTVLLELYSPLCPRVMWSTPHVVWLDGAAFVIRADAYQQLREAGISGFTACPVQVVKVATTGRRKHRGAGGDPEHLISKRTNVLEEAREVIPSLVGVLITGRCEVIPQSPDLDEGRIRPYDFAGDPTGDLFYPVFDGSRYGGHLFGIEHLRAAIVDPGSWNVAFTPFHEWRAGLA